MALRCAWKHRVDCRRITSSSSCCEQFALEPIRIYTASTGPVNLNRLSAMYDLVDAAGPEIPALHARRCPRNRRRRTDLFEQLRAGDVLLHHPFQSFAPVMDFLRQAAADPHVLAIKQTLYRAGTDSPIVEALVTAAHNRQGRHGDHRIARALRRGGQHRTWPTGCRKPART